MTKEIFLGQGLVALVDDEDYAFLCKYRWRARWGSTGKKPYVVATVRLHRLVTNCPEDLMVDHINGDTLDNRKANLRVCTNAQNQQNTKGRGGTSTHKGVSLNKRAGLWVGMFMFNGRRYYCGRFENEEECARAVDKKRREVCEDFASLNFPDSYD